MNKKLIPLLAIAMFTVVAAIDPADGVRAKLRLIESGRAQRGSVLVFTPPELNAYARSEIRTVVPEGVRQPRLELGNNRATAYALIDFLRVRHGQGEETPWLLSKLIEGERPVKVDAHIRSYGGKATIFLDRVEISGIAVSGSTLDFLIKNFFLPIYPNAQINRPFELSDSVDRIEVNPDQARVVMRK